MIDAGRLDEVGDELCAGFAGDLDGLASLDAESVERLAVAARRAREVLDRVEVHALGVLDASGATFARHGSLTPQWFAQETGVRPESAKAQVKVSRSLRRTLPQADAAWAEGRITRSHVDVLANAASNPRIRGVFGEVEGHLAGLAAGSTFAAWRRRVADTVARLDVDGPDPNDPEQTTASWSRSGPYGWLRAQFGGCSVEEFEQIVEARIEALHRAHVRDRRVDPDHVIPTRAQLRGQAIMAIVLESTGVELSRTTPPRPAVSLVLRAGGEASGAGSWPMFESVSDITWSLRNANGDHLVAAHFATLLCDCEAHPMLVDAEGNPLKLGRKVRFVNATLRRAVLIRDGGCTYPGCDCPPSWVDVHHIVRWEDDGGTDLDNLVALCRRHHGLAHTKGWTVRAVDGWCWWTTPTGHGFWSQRHGRQRAGPAPPGDLPRQAEAA